MIGISEVIDISPSNLDPSLCFSPKYRALLKRLEAKSSKFDLPMWINKGGNVSIVATGTGLKGSGKKKGLPNFLE